MSTFKSIEEERNFRVNELKKRLAETMYPSFEESVQIVEAEFARLVSLYPVLADWNLLFKKNSMNAIATCRWAKKSKGKLVSCREINFSKKYLGFMAKEVLLDVIRHEAAHAVDYETRGKSDHGKEWKRLAVQFGANPNRIAHGNYVNAYARIEPKFVCRTESGRLVKKFYRNIQLRSNFSQQHLKYLKAVNGEKLVMNEVIDGEEYFLYK